MSPPLRGRGLKRLDRVRLSTAAGLLSPPLRGRGLKQTIGRATETLCRVLVAPPAGAWIET